MIFTTPIKIRFAHCDPAGIVFYPRYFEIINGIVEDWCEEGLGTSFHEMHMVQGVGFPTVHIDIHFTKTSILGDQLQAHLKVLKLGRASLTISVCLIDEDNEARFNAELVLVMAHVKERKAIPIPEPLRERIALYLEDKDQEKE
jgi:4-hydroxybenzoyl-CoA thioesterase